jgi:hypothetical protein
MNELEAKRTKKVLSDFAKEVINGSKKELKRQGKLASKDLYRNMSFNIDVTANAIDLDINMEDYADFVDQGVSGIETKYNTPYSFKNKKPPVKFLQTWLKRKTGKFLARDRRSAAFAIQNNIFKHGLKPSRFYRTPFNKSFKELPDDVVEAYGLDVEDFAEFVLNV